jgi:predicted metal-dependent HD superfamily phosphohydrolase
MSADRIANGDDCHDGQRAGPNRARGAALGGALEANQAFGDLHDVIVERYAAPERHYHNLTHIAECLRELDRLPVTPAHPTIEAALWLHDAVYDSRSGDNEEQSAALMRAWCAASGVRDEVMASVERLILVTRNHLPNPSRRDECLVADIDLAILGREPVRFDEYEAQIRREYAWVDESAYRAGRARVLERFAQRDRIFVTPELHERYEQAARENLRRSLQRLKAPAERVRDSSG